MSEKDEFNRFLPNEQLDKDKLSIEIPAEQTPVQHERIPSGYEPMGEIQLRGRVFRSLAGGRVRWWVLISGWIIFGGFALLLVYTAVISSSLAALIPLAIMAIPLLVLWRGTTAKLSGRRRRESTMAASNVYDITLHLECIQHLFQAPELDPFAGHDNSLSGIEQILKELKPQPLMCLVRTTILLPQAKLSENIEQTCREALQRYCETRIHQITKEMKARRREGFMALQMGLIFLAACLLLATFFGKLVSLPEFFRQLLSEGFMIAGWVGLWHPIDLLLYSWWPYWRDKHLYKRIRDMELKIRAESRSEG